MKLRIEIEDNWIEIDCDVRNVGTVLQNVGKLVRLLGPEGAIAKLAAHALTDDDWEMVTSKVSRQ